MLNQTAFDCDAAFLSKVVGREVTNVQISYPPQGWSRGICKVHLEPKGVEPETVVIKYDCVDTVKHNIFERFLKFVSLNFDKSNQKEVYFYKNLREVVQTKGVHIPHFYYGDTTDSSFLNILLDSKTSFLMIILEDLSSYLNYPIATPLEDSQALLAIQALARLHASGWDNEDLLPPEFRIPQSFQIFDNKSLDVPDLPAFNLLIEENSYILGCEDLGPLKEAFAVLFPFYHKVVHNFDYFAVRCPSNGKHFQHFTLLHGDYHSGNLFFKPPGLPESSPDVLHIDWQGYGRGPCACEVTYFLCTLPAPPSAHGPLIAAYHEELLRALGPSAPSYPLALLQEEISILLFQAAVAGISRFQGFMTKLMTKTERFQEFAITLKKINAKKHLYFIEEVNKWKSEGRFEAWGT